MAKHDDIDFINLNDIDDGPPLLPADSYHVKMVDGEVKTVKGDPNRRYVNYRAVVQSGEKAGASVFSAWFFDKDNVWRFKRDMKRMGYNPAGGIPHLADLLGMEGIAKVTVQEEKNGYPAKNQIQEWIGPLK